MIKFDFQGLTPQEESAELFSEEDFNFTKIQTDIDKLVHVAGNYMQVENVIVIGRGGSISTFRALWYSIGQYVSDKKVYIVDTLDPDYIFYIKEKCMPQNSLVIAISKSGSTTDVIENVLEFIDFPQVIITSENKEALYAIARQNGSYVLSHQNVGGRFAGLTEVGLLPAIIAGINITEVRKGAEQAYADFEKEKEDVKNLALIIKEFSEKGYNEVFWQIYSKKLAAFSELISQLINESSAKEGKGITPILAEGPESQHFMSQRFFGGTHNMFGLFTTVGSFYEDEGIKVPEGLKNIILRNMNLANFEGQKMSDGMNYEFQGTFQETINKKIPAVCLELEKVDEFNVGYFIAFLQVFAIYLSRSFEVNPFDQPEVENAKNLSFEARRNRRAI